MPSDKEPQTAESFEGRVVLFSAQTRGSCSYHSRPRWFRGNARGAGALWEHLRCDGVCRQSAWKGAKEKKRKKDKGKKEKKQEPQTDSDIIAPPFAAAGVFSFCVCSVVPLLEGRLESQRPLIPGRAQIAPELQLKRLSPIRGVCQFNSEVFRWLKSSPRRDRRSKPSRPVQAQEQVSRS